MNGCALAQWSTSAIVGENLPSSILSAPDHAIKVAIVIVIAQALIARRVFFC